MLKRKIRIDSKEKMAEAIEKNQLLPFFPNNIRGLSIEEMCAPGMLFGGNYDEGCWEWKGPVIREREAAYGKFYRKKAGFVEKGLLADFLNYRRNRYPVAVGSIDEMILDIIRVNDSMTSTELKQLIFGRKKRVSFDELPEKDNIVQSKGKSKSLESPLQRLQMGGWLIISDFEYKRTKQGERYGWGVARYSTPEAVFEDILNDGIKREPGESLERMIKQMKKNWWGVSEKEWLKLLK